MTAWLLSIPFVIGVLATTMALTLVRGQPGALRLSLAGLGFLVGALIAAAMVTPCVRQQWVHGSFDHCQPAAMVTVNPWTTATLLAR